jgi:CubicO group peptidase (beta-lactamase class C family)
VQLQAVADLGTSSKVQRTPYTHFRAASNTKTMTAAVIVLLVQEGKLRFDDPVSKYVEGVPNGDNITISQLLKMRSGLYNYTSAPELRESLDHDPTKVWTPQELLAIAFKRPTIFAPGNGYDYCNTNYALLGLIAEKLEGAPLAKIFQDRLFGPLGMKHTLLPANTSSTIPEPYSMAICTAVPRTPWWMRPIPPIFRLRPRREPSSPMTTRGRILPMPSLPEASSRPRMI